MSNDGKYTFGLVGCGRIGERHAEILTSGRIGRVKLVGVSDLKESKKDNFSGKYKVPGFVETEKMIETTNPDILVICTESGNHKRNVIEYAKFKKHFIVEKPLALNIEDACEMIKICSDKKINLYTVKQNRFNLPIVKTKEYFDKGYFGNIFLGTVRVRWKRDQKYYDQDSWRGTWKLDGGVLSNQASHHIDILQYFLGDVESVFAYGKTALVSIEAEDTAVAVVKFKSGALGIIEATNATRPIDLEGSLSLLGERGTVVVGGFALNKLVTWKFNESVDSLVKNFDEYSENPPDVYGFGHQKYYERLVEHLDNPETPFISGEDGKKTVEIIGALYKSMETGLEVKLPLREGHSRLGKNES